MKITVEFSYDDENPDEAARAKELIRQLNALSKREGLPKPQLRRRPAPVERGRDYGGIVRNATGLIQTKIVGRRKT